MARKLEPIDCHCFATRQLARHVSKLYERHLSRVRLTSTQLSILVFLQQSPGMTMNELARMMVMDRTTLLRAVKPLQREGLVVSAPTTCVARQLAFSVVPKGARKIEEALPLWQAAQREYEAQIGSQQAKRLRRQFLNMTRSD